MKHTATPYSVLENDGKYLVGNHKGAELAAVCGEYETAAYIVHCVNIHDALVEALNLAERFIAAEVKTRDEKLGDGISTTLDIIRALLAKEAEHAK